MNAPAAASTWSLCLPNDHGSHSRDQAAFQSNSPRQDRVSAQAPRQLPSHRGPPILRQLQLSSAKLENSAPPGGEGQVAPWRALSRVGLHVVAVQADETRVEVGLIGREGMSGVAAIGRKRDNLGAPNVFWAALRSAIRARRRRRTVDETVKEIPLRMLNTRMRERAGESLCCDLRPKSDVAPHERARDVPPLN